MIPVLLPQRNWSFSNKAPGKGSGMWNWKSNGLTLYIWTVPVIVVFTKFDGRIIQEYSRLDEGKLDEEARWSQAKTNAKDTLQNVYVPLVRDAPCPPKRLIWLEGGEVCHCIPSGLTKTKICTTEINSALNWQTKQQQWSTIPVFVDCLSQCKGTTSTCASERVLSMAEIWSVVLYWPKLTGVLRMVRYSASVT